MCHILQWRAHAHVTRAAGSNFQSIPPKRCCLLPCSLSIQTCQNEWYDQMQKISGSIMSAQCTISLSNLKQWNLKLFLQQLSRLNLVRINLNPMDNKATILIYYSSIVFLSFISTFSYLSLIDTSTPSLPYLLGFIPSQIPPIQPSAPLKFHHWQTIPTHHLEPSPVLQGPLLSPSPLKHHQTALHWETTFSFSSVPPCQA